MSEHEPDDKDMIYVDGRADSAGNDLSILDVSRRKSYRRLIEEYEESKWLRAALDDI